MDFHIATVSQLPAHLRALRKARHLTQAELGRLLGVKQSRIADIEADPGSISVTQMHKLLSALGTQLVLRDSGDGWQPVVRDAATARTGVHTPAHTARKPGGSW
jgi:HTH-type transcriptional regulator/antitoxin HipB